MPTISNNRAIVLMINNGWGQVTPALLIKNDAIIPFDAYFNIGGSGTPINNLFVKSIQIDGKGAIGNNTDGMSFYIDGTDYINIKTAVIELKKLVDLKGNNIKNIAELGLSSGYTYNDVIKRNLDNISIGLGHDLGVVYSLKIFQNYIELLRTTITEIDLQPNDSKIAVTKEWVLSKAITKNANGDLDLSSTKIIGANNSYIRLTGGQADFYNDGDIRIEAVNPDSKVYLSVNGLNAIILGKDVISFDKSVEKISYHVINIGSAANPFDNGYFDNVKVSNGATGSFTSQDGKTITVTDGIITGIV